VSRKKGRKAVGGLEFSLARMRPAYQREIQIRFAMAELAPGITCAFDASITWEGYRYVKAE
jgi:hypothetical protein